MDGNVRPFRLEPEDLVILTHGVAALSRSRIPARVCRRQSQRGLRGGQGRGAGRASEQQDESHHRRPPVCLRGGIPLPAFGNLRSKLPVAGACLLLAVNVYAATFALNQVRTRMATLQGKTVTKPKELGAGPGPVGTRR